jgi:type II secretory pathway predicted ATPase ExeA
MYESFFGLTERPFAVAPHAAHYYPAAAIEAARLTLTRLIQRAEGAGLLIGLPGMGKTLLFQVLAEQLRGDFRLATLASGRICTRRALLQAVLFEMNLPFRGLDEGELRLSLIDHLSQLDAPPLVLLVDEAPSLPLRLLEELRLITNLVRRGEPRVRLVLAGGPILEERFASPKLDSFNQRVAARCYLESLTRDETIGYVRQRLAASGAAPEAIFSPDALEAICRATDGVPRLINQLCDHALILGCAGGVSHLTAAAIEEAWADLQQLPTPWGVSRDEAANDEIIEFGSLDHGSAMEWEADEPAAVPFHRHVGDAANGASSPEEQIDQIQRQLAALDEEFAPDAAEPEVELFLRASDDPFHEAFMDEEVIVDRYAAFDQNALANRPLVVSREGQHLAELLNRCAAPVPRVVAADEALAEGDPQPNDAAAHSSEKPSPAAAHDQAAPLPGVGYAMEPRPAPMAAEPDDRDLIVIEDDPAPMAEDMQPAARVRRHEYRQLFAQLRRG